MFYLTVARLKTRSLWTLGHTCHWFTETARITSVVVAVDGNVTVQQLIHIIWIRQQWNFTVRQILRTDESVACERGVTEHFNYYGRTFRLIWYCSHWLVHHSTHFYSLCCIHFTHKLVNFKCNEITFDLPFWICGRIRGI